MVFYDFVKAYDNINRQILVRKYLQNGVNPTIVRAKKNLLTNTWMDLNGELIPTEKGSPQGSTISGDNWNYYVADLARKIERVMQRNSRFYKRGEDNEYHEKAQPYFFVDDLAVIVRGRKALEEVH